MKQAKGEERRRRREGRKEGGNGRKREGRGGKRGMPQDRYMECLTDEEI